MTDEIKHPLRSANIAVYQRIRGENSPAFIAKIEPISAHPIYFTGPTAMETMKTARDWINEQADKHEAKFQQREALRRARTKKKGDAE